MGLEIFILKEGTESRVAKWKDVQLGLVFESDLYVMGKIHLNWENILGRLQKGEERLTLAE